MCCGDGSGHGDGGDAAFFRQDLALRGHSLECCSRAWDVACVVYNAARLVKRYCCVCV